jgi:hypothetical protein
MIPASMRTIFPEQQATPAVAPSTMRSSRTDYIVFVVAVASLFLSCLSSAQITIDTRKSGPVATQAGQETQVDRQ